MRTARLLATALAVVHATGCTRVPDEYACTAHAQCADALAEGRCELTGSCSVPDTSCSSTRRYVDDFAGSMSGACVADDLPTWLVTLGGVGNDLPSAITVDAAGNPIAYGGFEADLHGEVEASSAGGADLLLVSLDGSTGKAGWSLQGSGAQLDRATDLSWSGTSTLTIGGFTSGNLRFGADVLDAPAPGGDAFVAMFTVDPEPVLQLGAHTEGTASEEAWAVGDGAIVAGTFSGGTLAIAGATLAPGSAARDGWIAKLAANGAATWSLAYGGAAASDRVTVSALGGSGSTAVVVGGFSGSVTFPGGTATASRGGTDGFMFKINTGTGSPAGPAVVVGGQGNDLVHAVAADASGQLWLAGYVEGPALVGTTMSQAIGARDALVSQSAGGLRWRVGAAGQNTEAIAIAFDASDRLIVVGTFEDTLELGAVTLAGHGGLDVFVCKISPEDGAVLWATAFGGSGDDVPADVTVLPSGDVVVVGSFTATADFGGVDRTAAGQSDWFVAALPSR